MNQLQHTLFVFVIFLNLLPELIQIIRLLEYFNEYYLFFVAGVIQAVEVVNNSFVNIT